MPNGGFFISTPVSTQTIAILQHDLRLVKNQKINITKKTLNKKKSVNLHLVQSVSYIYNKQIIGGLR